MKLIYSNSKSYFSQVLKYWILVISLLVSFASSAQKEQSLNLGNEVDFSNHILATKNNQLNLDIPGKGKISAVIKKKQVDQSSYSIEGILDNNNEALFYISKQKGKIEGTVVFRKENKAYKYASNKRAEVILTEVSMKDIMCIGIEKKTYPSAFDTFFMNKRKKSISNLNAMDLQSLPESGFTIYLDFDGEVVNDDWWSDSTINARSAGFNDQEIIEVWKIMAEDFRPFFLNVTTRRDVYEATPVNQRMMCIFTPTDTAGPGSGGVAYLDTFASSRNTHCWVFNLWPRGAGETGSHEIGHTLGLDHDGRPGETYYSGHGKWSPIMGWSADTSLGHWSKGEYNNANNQEDDLAIIANNRNGFGYKQDDHDNAINNATELVIDTSGNVNPNENSGVITTANDIDVFAFTTNGGAVSFSVQPDPFYPNLNIRVRLLNSIGSVVESYNPTNSFGATMNTTLDRGTYFLEIDGVGEGNISSGFSDYSSIGLYTVSGSYETGSDVSFTINTDQGSQKVCAVNSNSVSYAIEITPNTNSNQGDVVLSASGNPAGSVVSFSQNPVALNTSREVMMTVSGLDNAGEGNYSILVKGERDNEEVLLGLDLELNCSVTECLLTENFENGQPQGWSFNVEPSGEFTFSSGVLSPNWDEARFPNPGDGSWVFFDDSEVNSSSTINNVATITTKSINKTGYNDVQLSFDFTNQEYQNDGQIQLSVNDGNNTYYWNGSSWVTQNIFWVTTSISGSFEEALPTQLGDQFTVSLIFDDETTWGWGFGIDNFEVCASVEIIGDTFALSTDQNTQNNCEVYEDSVAYTIDIDSDKGNYIGAIEFSANGYPDGATVSFSQNPITIDGSGQTTMTITGLNEVAEGDYSITVTGVGTNTADTLDVNLTVCEVPVLATFALSTDQNTQDNCEEYEDSVAYTIDIASDTGNYVGAIEFNVNGYPNGATVSFSQNPITINGSGQVVMTITGLNEIAEGDYTITVTGEGTNNSYGLDVELTVCEEAVATTIALSTDQSTKDNCDEYEDSVVYTIDIASDTGNYVGAIEFSANGYPDGTTVSFSQNPITIDGSGQVVMTITGLNAAADGDYTIVVNGVGTNAAAAIDVNLAVCEEPVDATFVLSTDQSSQRTCSDQSSSVTYVIDITSNSGSYTGAIDFRVSDNPLGSEVSFSENPLVLNGNGQLVMTVTGLDTVTEGGYTMTVIGEGDSLTKSLELGLILECTTSNCLYTENFENGRPEGWSFDVQPSGSFTFSSGVLSPDWNEAQFPNPGDGAWVFFDDSEVNSSSSVNNIATMTSKTFNGVGYENLSLVFDYTSQEYRNDGQLQLSVSDGNNTYYWNGSRWVTTNVFWVTNSQSGVFTQSLPSELGESFQVSFVYDDERTWGWGFGIDNFEICGTRVIDNPPSDSECFFTENFENGQPSAWKFDVKPSGSFTFSSDVLAPDWRDGQFPNPGEGSWMFFDDSAVNSTTRVRNIATASTGVIDANGYIELAMSFDFTSQEYRNDGQLQLSVRDENNTYYWDGTNWVSDSVFWVTTSMEGTFTEALPTQLATTFEVSFVYDDETNWGWGFGIDNFAICGIKGARNEENNVYAFKANPVKMYPNPASDIVHIDTSENLLEGSLASVIIYNLNGQKLFETTQNLSDNNTLNIAKLPVDQVYIVFVRDRDGKYYSFKLLK